MSERKYMSGAQKRKLRQEKCEKAHKLPKISSFFEKAPEASASTSVKIIGADENVAIVEQESNIAASENEDECDQEDLTHFVTDRALFSGHLSDDVKRKIIAAGPNKPMGPFPKNENDNRAFSTDYYVVKTRTGQQIDRFWLCYSQALNGVYCQPCWLFSDNVKAVSWCKGTINDWRGLSKKIKIHEESHAHLESCITYSTWEKNRTIDNRRSSNEKIKEVLIRICDVIRTLSICNMALRGHRESISAYEIGATSGNFLNIIDLISRYDPILKAHLSNTNIRNKYLSPDIQNEIITHLAKSVLEKITEGINDAPFFSLIIDSTQDISKKDQLSIVIRYASIKPNADKGVHNKLEVKESFIGFIELTEQNSQNLENVVLTALDNFKIKIEKCRGQGYDGAANMSGKYSGLQARIKNRVATADYVHCSAHNLNLVLNDSVKNIREIQNFYGLLQSIYVFFSESLPRWQALNETSLHVNKMKYTPKKLCLTRWSSRYECLLSIRYNYQSVMQCLSNFILLCKKPNDRNEAKSLQNKMDSYEFILILVFQSKILEAVNLISKLLQSPSCDLEKACELLNTGQKNLSQLRHNFDKLEEEANSLAKSWNIQPKLKEKRQKKFFDEFEDGCVIPNPLKKFQIEVFNASLDIIINQLSRRFSSINEIVKLFTFLNPSKFISLTNEAIMECGRQVLSKYGDDFSEDLPIQLINFKTVFSNDIKQKSSIKELANLLIVENTCVATSLPDLCTLFQLYLTLPVTSATAERSFSKLKLIKTYLRSTIKQVRLSALAVISIEHKQSKSVNLEELVENFMLLKKRRFCVSSSN